MPDDFFTDEEWAAMLGPFVDACINYAKAEAAVEASLERLREGEG